MEPLAESIRKHADITGIEVQHKLILLAVDLVLTILNPCVSLPNLHSLKIFFWISELDINVNKSKAQNVTLPADTLTDLQD